MKLRIIIPQLPQTRSLFQNLQGHQVIKLYHLKVQYCWNMPSTARRPTLYPHLTSSNCFTVKETSLTRPNSGIYFSKTWQTRFPNYAKAAFSSLNYCASSRKTAII